MKNAAVKEFPKMVYGPNGEKRIVNSKAEIPKGYGSRNEIVNGEVSSKVKPSTDDSASKSDAKKADKHAENAQDLQETKKTEKSQQEESKNEQTPSHEDEVVAELQAKNKPEIVEIAEGLEISTEGTKDELIARIVEAVKNADSEVL